MREYDFDLMGEKGAKGYGPLFKGELALYPYPPLSLWWRFRSNDLYLFTLKPAHYILPSEFIDNE